MRITWLLLLVIFSFALVMSCSEDKSTSPSTDGTLKILLTDSPCEFEEVNITFSEIAVHAGDDTSDTEGEWIVINSETQTFNLLTLSNGVTSLLGEKKLEPRHYTQIRLEITDAELIVNSETFSLDVPSAKLKFVKGFDLTDGIETKLIVDFDAARSIHQTGNDQYKLQPTIRVITEDQSGAITGTVTNPENVPVAYAIAESDTVTSSFVNIETGSFKLAFLPENTYTVAVTDTLNQTSVNESIVVTVGNITALGDITLE